MQSASSQTGISRAMLRFSHWAVAVGKVPSFGIRLTGTLSPSPAMIGASVFCTNSGASAGTARPDVEGAGHRGRHLHLVQVVERRVHGGEVLLHHRLAALAVGLLDGVLDGGDGFLAAAARR